MSEQPTQEQNQEQEKKPVAAVPARPSLGEKITSLWYSKRAWAVLGVLVFLLGIGTLVPVGKIPFLRSLAYAMGYTQDEMSHLSFLKALFSWNDHAKMLRGELPDPSERAIFGEGGGFFASRSDRAQNKLFNLRSVNAGLARQGRRREQVADSANRPQGEDRRASDIRVRNADASANTQSNQAKTGDVYFGTDASEIARDKNDGFNSVNSLKKIKNPHIAGGASAASGLDRLLDKAVRADSQLENIAKGIDKSGSSLAQLGNVSSIGDSRAKRDMYYAWLTGRAARRTPQIVLKKTLATSGFNGAELPRSVFTAGGFSGVGIKPDDVIADMDSVQKYLQQDKDCQAAIAQGGNAVPSYNEVVGVESAIVHAFQGATCASGLGVYTGQLVAMNGTCNRMREAYQNIQSGCATLSIILGDYQCQAEHLRAYANAFTQYCQRELEGCANPEDPDAQAACEAEVNARGTNRTFTDNDGLSFNGVELPSIAHSTFFNDNHGYSSDYFPSVDWAHSLWVDENAGD